MLLQVTEDIVRVFQTDRKPDIAWRDTGLQLFRPRKLGMRRRRGVDRQAAGVADIRDVVE